MRRVCLPDEKEMTGLKSGENKLIGYMTTIDQLEKLIQLGHYARARHLAQELLADHTELRIKQLYALALSKSGVPEAAMDYLEKVAREQPDDVETMGILGGIYKELFKKNQSTKYATLSCETYDKNFQLSYKTYDTNFQATKSYYTGINAATMSVLAGRARRGKEIAQEVLTLLTNPETDFWEAATQAEAYLLLKEKAKAEHWYRHARTLAGTDWGRVNSVYNQLWLLNHYIPVGKELLHLFSPPVVVSFTGHMIDHPQRSSPRFPATIEKEMKSAIRSAIRNLNAKIGYTSLACGADILFAEAMEEEGGEVNLYLPFRQDDFIESSVRFAGEQWVERFLRLVNKHQVTFLTQEEYDHHPDLFNLTTGILFGLSCLRSAANAKEPALITLLSERDASRKVGGARETLELWPYPKNRVVINPDLLVPDTGSNAVPAVTAPSPAPVNNRPVLYLVACDLGAEEKSTEALVEELESSVTPATAFDLGAHRLIAGFTSAFSAMAFCRLVIRTLKNPFHQKDTYRISLHVGPVRIADTIKQSLSGDTIATLEKLHAITVPGAVCATSMMAAILALEPKKYTFDYIDTVSSEGSAKALDVFKVGVQP